MFTFEVILFREDIGTRLNSRRIKRQLEWSHAIFTWFWTTAILSTLWLPLKISFYLSLGVICKIVRSWDHLSSFRCTGIRAYNGKAKFRLSSLLLTNDITFDCFAILWLVKRSVLWWLNFYHRHTLVLRKYFKWQPQKATFTNLSLGVISKIIWNRDHLRSFRALVCYSSIG